MAGKLKDGWKIYRFDQMAINVNERINDPSKADTDYYVGLEHLDSDSLKIRRWGTPSDVQATKLIFRKGDIIFGRRRVYLRKVAVADFDGICSAHALVLRARSEVVVPEFLPFFMQSDLFMERAKTISVGSLSPTINWKTLAKQEFALPPLEKQRQLLKLFKASNENSERLQVAANFIYQLEISWLKKIFENRNFLNYRKMRLVDLLDKPPESGVSAPPTINETGHSVLALSALSEVGYVTGQLKPVIPTNEMVSALLKHEDLIISRSNTLDRVGFVGIYNGEREGSVSFPDTMMRLSLQKDIVLPSYLELYLQSPIARYEIRSIAAGTSASMKKINKANLQNLSILLPSLDIQQALVNKRQQIIYGRLAILERLKQTRNQHRIFIKHAMLKNLG